MSVITPDGGLRRSIKRLTTATGATADFAANSGQIDSTRPIDLAIFDARQHLPDRVFFAQIPPQAHILCIVSPDNLVDQICLFEDPRVTSLFSHDERFDDDEFIASATKALRGEIFGLQKYFPWGVTTFTMLVKNYEDKTRAIDIMMGYARTAGVRGPVRDRIQLVADELMMNALYHAPTDDSGQEKYRGKTVKQLAQLAEVNPIQVQYGCSGRHFGVAVRDGGGSLGRDRAIDYLGRAGSGAAVEDKPTGAGLGLVSVLHSVSKLVFNLAPTYSTEVIGLIDMELFAHGKVGARSVHLFTASSSPVAVEEEDAAKGAVARSRARMQPRLRTGGLVMAALVGAVVAGLGTAYYFHHADPEGQVTAGMHPGNAPSVAVFADPAQARITIDSAPVAQGARVRFPPTATEVELRVEHPGYRPWSHRLSTGDLSQAPSVQVHVRLDRDR